MRPPEKPIPPPTRYVSQGVPRKRKDDHGGCNDWVGHVTIFVVGFISGLIIIESMGGLTCTN